MPIRPENKHRYPLFSNGTEFTVWMDGNCDRCVKASRYNEKTDTYTKYRCAVNKEIIFAYLDDGCGTKKTYDMIRNGDCPCIQTEWKKRPSKPKFDNQPKLFDP